MPETHTIGSVVGEAARHLDENGIEDARRTAQLLMQHLLKVETAELITRDGEMLTADQLARYGGFIRRRLRPEPLQYIMRRADFWSHEFYVDQRVLIPRPESEHIIEQVQADFPDRSGVLSIADVGTGCGCLAITLALEYPKSKIIGIDIEVGALEVASINCSRLNVTGRVDLRNGDLLEPVLIDRELPPIDVVVANPPYVSLSDASTLPSVVKAEPHKALFSGPSGYEVIAKLLPQIAAVLAAQGRFYLECGAGQAEQVESLIHQEPQLNHIRTVADHQGIPRVIVGNKRK